MAKVLPTLRKQQHPLADSTYQRRLLDDLSLRPFAEAAASAGHRPLKAAGISVLQLNVLAQSDIPTLDITGGAPEMHPDFREIVERATALGRHVMDRCNLSITRL